MRAQLKGLHSPDVDLPHFQPENPDRYCFLLQAFIGPENAPGDDSFSFVVCTPSWLKEKEGEITFGANYIIVTGYDLRGIEECLKRLCERSIGDTWPEVANKSSWITCGRWKPSTWASLEIARRPKLLHSGRSKSVT